MLPYPKKNPWHPPKRRVIIYHDSNVLYTKDHVKEELRRVGAKIGKKEEFDIDFIPSMSVATTHYAVKHENHKFHRDYKDAIVLMHIGTNDIRWKYESPHDPRSQKDTHHLLKETIMLLKKETSNIVIMETPPSTKFFMAPFNSFAYNLCKAQQIHFGYTLVGKHNIARDGYHVKFTVPYLVPQSIAAALHKVDPFRIYDHPRPFGN